MCPVLTPRLDITCGLSLWVLYSALRGFSLGILVFLSSQNPIYNIDLSLVGLIYYIMSIPYRLRQDIQPGLYSLGAGYNKSPQVPGLSFLSS